MRDEPKEFPNAWRAVEFVPTAAATELQFSLDPLIKTAHTTRSARHVRFAAEGDRACAPAVLAEQAKA